MIFVLDIGNRNTMLGVFSDDKLKYSWRIRTDRQKTEDEIGMLVKSLFDFNGLHLKDSNRIIGSAVVPAIIQAIEVMCRMYFNNQPMIVGGVSVHSHLKITYPRPRELGADCIVNAVGSLTKYEPPLIIIDFATATTFCYVDRQGAYNGGIITPGINVSMDALYRHAAKLPKIEI